MLRHCTGATPLGRRRGLGPFVGGLGGAWRGGCARPLPAWGEIGMRGGAEDGHGCPVLLQIHAHSAALTARGLGYWRDSPPLAANGAAVSPNIATRSALR